MKENILNLNLENLTEFLVNNNKKKYLASQIFEWIYVHRIFDFNQMTNLSKENILFLENNFIFDFMSIKKKQETKDAIKYLFELTDYNFIEAVVMKHNYGNSLCLSTQIGCNMGCSFCESGRLKKVRNLEVHEMVEPILLIEKDLKLRISSIVLMGIGEPLDNYDNVMKFVHLINEPKYLAIGARHITISTCGIVPKIKELMTDTMQFNLALSLHAPNNTLRSKIMKINDAYNIEEIFTVLKQYIAKTNRRVTIEYVMINNVNDSEDLAKELVSLIKGMNVYVNLIPYNETSHINYQRSSKEHIDTFYNILKNNKINVTCRREFGKNIDAACGQLRAKEVKE